MRFIFDCETNGLLPEVTKMHSLVLMDADTGELFSCSDHWEESEKPLYKLSFGLDLLAKADEIIGHNIIAFDVPVLEKLYGFKTRARITDTIVLTRLIWPDLYEEDVPKVKRGQLPSRLMSNHSLEAWGYRLGVMKGEYGRDENGKQMPGIWAAWNEEMQHYAEQDVAVTKALYDRIVKKRVDPRAWELEHRFATIIAMQERNGFYFNEAAAQELYVTLVGRRLALRHQLLEAFPPITKRESFIPKVNNKNRGYVKGQPTIKEKVIEFNPGSRQMIGERLKAMGWVPEEFTETGQPKVDETILSKLPYPEAKLLAEFFLVDKRIGQLAEGDQAWLRLVRNSRIHGSVNTNGAVTGRCTHSRPNVAQVPRVGSPYGQECRALFMARPGWTLIGADLSGLELRCLAHYMAKYDGGAYGVVLLEGDIHWANVIAMWLCEEERNDDRKDHKIIRNGAKTFIYGFLYGAGDEKVGRIVFDVIMALKGAGLEYRHLLTRFFKGVENPSVDDFKRAGAKLKKTFLAKTPALKSLREAVKEKAEATKTLRGLDGRVLKVRSGHAALNTLLQSAGALIAKLATVIAYDELSTRGYVFGRDYALVAHVHDEMQIEAREDIADEVGRVVVEAMRRAGEDFGFRIPIAGEYKIGRTWADTH